MTCIISEALLIKSHLSLHLTKVSVLENESLSFSKWSLKILTHGRYSRCIIKER